MPKNIETKINIDGIDGLFYEAIDFKTSPNRKKFKNIKEVFKYHMSKTKYDKKLYEKIKSFRMHWVNKNKNNIEFLSGHLLGVNPVRFTMEDDTSFFVDILNVEQKDLRIDLHGLEDINVGWQVTSNSFYLTITWLLHAFTVSKDIGNKKEDVLRELYYIMAYKITGSLMSWYFKYDLDRNTAITVYEKLSNRFIIKKVGNWQSFFEYRSQDVLKDSIHGERIRTLSTYDAIRIIMDLQGKIRDTFKEIYVVIDKVKTEDEAKKVSTMINTYEEDDSIGEIIDRPDKYTIYLKNIIYKENDFIKPDLVDLMGDVFPNMDKNLFFEVLRYLSEISLSKSKEIHELIDDILEANLNYLMSKGLKNGYDRNVINVIILLKGFWISSKVKDEKLLKSKKKISALIGEVSDKKTEWKRVTVVIGVGIYLTLRGIGKDSFN